MQKQEKDRYRLEEHESLAGVVLPSLFSSLKILPVCFVLAYLTAGYLMRPLHVQGGSTYPTLKMGEFEFGSAFSSHFRGIKYGDIVIVYNKKKMHTYWVKRIISLSGERICASGDTVYINDTAIQEPYLDNDYADSIWSTENCKFIEDFDEVQLGEGEYYLMGDNHHVSKDSREVRIFKRGDIRATDFFIVLPFNKMGVAEQDMSKNKRIRSNLDVVYIILDFARLILTTVVAVMVILVLTARKEGVRSTSMYPTLVEDESVAINMTANYVGEIKRFDVVVAREYRSDDLWVKRVIELPGEMISYCEDMLYADRRAMEEPFLDKKHVEQVKKGTDKLYFTQDYTSKELGGNEYLLVGDNRNESLDSRSDTVRPFQQERIIARGVFACQPFSKARYVDNGGW